VGFWDGLCVLWERGWPWLLQHLAGKAPGRRHRVLLGVEELEVRWVPNSAPVAIADSYEVLHAQQLTVSSPGVLENDTDADLDTLSTNLVTDVSHGSLSLSSDGGFSYTPAGGYSGSDSFEYQAYDGTDYGNTVLVSIDVTDAAPTADDDAFDLHGDTLTVGSVDSVLNNDSDPDLDSLTAEKVSDPAHGSLTFYSDGTFEYTATAGFTGVDSFTYRVFDGALYSSAATVTITGQAPTASADSYEVEEDQFLSVMASGVLGNDSDPDPEDSLTAVLYTDVSHGSLVLNSNGGFDYTPNSGYVGTDNFQYQAFDGALYSTITTVIINVTATAPPPPADLHFFVNTLADTHDANLQDGQATDAQGNTSLRAAIEQINATGGASNTIEISLTGTVQLTLQSPLVISRNTQLTGGGMGSLIVRGAGNTQNPADWNRIFEISASTTVSMTDFTIRNGRAWLLDPNFGGKGGGILNHGNLTLQTMEVSYNRADDKGGGIYNDGTLSGSEVWITDNLWGDGAGLYNAGTANLSWGQILSNQSDGGGGGIYNASGATLTLAFMDIMSNQGNGGGGIYNAGSLSGDNLNLSNNQTTGYGGGLFNTSNANPTISNSWIRNNSANKGGGLYINSGTLTLLYCDISDNTATVLGSAACRDPVTGHWIKTDCTGNGDWKDDVI
jgi:Bacterial Ig domain